MDRREHRHQWWHTVDEKHMVATVLTEDADGCEIEVRIPIEFEVCDTCGGRGSYVNPSIDSHGLGAEDFAEDPDFAEMYWSGAYDQVCHDCNGTRVMPTVATFASDAQKQTYEQAIDAIHERNKEIEFERRYGW
jgi:hypothetical protein